MEDIKRKELKSRCIDLLMKTYMELGQSPDVDTVDMNADLLVNDIQERYNKMTWKVITLAFENGVRETDDFSINVKTWNKWLTTMKHKIWAGVYDIQNGGKHKVTKQIQSIITNQKLIE